MSGDRDELARDIDPGAYAETIVRDPRSENEATKRKQAAEKTADALWAAGWRKKPNVEAIIEALESESNWTQGSPRIFMEAKAADAILALLDGGLSETGEK